MWEILGEGMIGYLLLVDAEREDSMQEAAASSRPSVDGSRAVRRGAQPGRADDNVLIEASARASRSPPTWPSWPCDDDKESVKNVLLALLYAVLDEVEAEAVRA